MNCDFYLRNTTNSDLHEQVCERYCIPYFSLLEVVRKEILIYIHWINKLDFEKDFLQGDTRFSPTYVLFLSHEQK